MLYMMLHAEKYLVCAILAILCFTVQELILSITVLTEVCFEIFIMWIKVVIFSTCRTKGMPNIIMFWKLKCYT
jgi:hypothetical protein